MDPASVTRRFRQRGGDLKPRQTSIIRVLPSTMLNLVIGILLIMCCWISNPQQIVFAVSMKKSENSDSTQRGRQSQQAGMQGRQNLNPNPNTSSNNNPALTSPTPIRGTPNGQGLPSHLLAQMQTDSRFTESPDGQDRVRAITSMPDLGFERRGSTSSDRSSDHEYFHFGIV